MKGNEGQRIKEMSTAQVIVWGRRQQKFGRDVVMLCRGVGGEGKHFPCFLCWFKKRLSDLLVANVLIQKNDLQVTESCTARVFPLMRGNAGLQD